MPDDAGTAARRELLTAVGETMKAIRLFKHGMALHHPAVPTGTLQLLAAIDRMSPGIETACHLKDLAAHSALDPSTVSRAVAALVKSGLVARTADPTDGRASVLTVTPHGLQTLDEVIGWADERLADALREWTTEDIAVFNALTQRFATDLTSRYDTSLEAAR
ncbi:MarR family winged helix-turn-helix transcriptional regulator [Actinoplanes sp. N902-109]|uniref:MarR family winged helix-turn-helix transcriptional regulator n=1 Tax=Actinoplanes sp. (strain N902-109) TaxID=649831 RepID=UPI0003296296|nr:MarR family transcriptional regulator [Actinoplanes sp. N902-109]AGL21510.1 MarR family transcriptional regulator [Actinoplanes sp. N902-109]